MPLLKRLTISSMWIKDVKQYQTLFKDGAMPTLQYFWPKLKRLYNYKKHRRLDSHPIDDIKEKVELMQELFPNINLADEAKYRITHPNPENEIQQFHKFLSGEKYPLWEKEPKLTINSGLDMHIFGRFPWPGVGLY